jgi:acid phosphatase family membrane protein YuiD
MIDDIFADFTSNILSAYIASFCIAWLIAHLIKYIIGRIKKEKLGIQSYLLVSGGMPSSHSATTISLTTVIGLSSGFGSEIFALAALFSIIVMYDALMVRRSSGEQGIAIQGVIKEQKSKVKSPRVAMGHKPVEVFAGAILGVSVGLVVFLATLF